MDNQRIGNYPQNANKKNKIKQIKRQTKHKKELKECMNIHTNKFYIINKINYTIRGQKILFLIYFFD